MAISPKLLNEGEHVVVSTRTHPKALIGPVVVFLLALAAAVWITSLDLGSGGGARVLSIVVWGVAAVVIAWFTLKPVIDWIFTTYTFTNRRFIKRSGMIAREGRTIPLNRISGVDFEQGVIDRIFGCGTLVVTDASTDGRVELHDIPTIEQVQKRVAEELNRVAGADGTGAPAPRHDEGA